MRMLTRVHTHFSEYLQHVTGGTDAGCVVKVVLKKFGGLVVT